MTISRELLDELLEGCERPEDLPGDTGLLKELRIKLMERDRSVKEPWRTAGRPGYAADAA